MPRKQFSAEVVVNQTIDNAAFINIFGKNQVVYDGGKTMTPANTAGAEVTCASVVAPANPNILGKSLVTIQNTSQDCDVLIKFINIEYMNFNTITTAWGVVDSVLVENGKEVCYMVDGWMLGQGCVATATPQTTPSQNFDLKLKVRIV